MKISEWLDLFLRNGGKKLFSLSDLVLLTGEGRGSVSVQLNRLVASGVVKRPVRGWYANPFAPPSDEELAMVIRAPSYLSMEYALSRHGILSQSVHTCTLVTTRLPYTFRTTSATFEYHQVKRPLHWGYQDEGGVLVATPEKALLDLIYIRVVRGRAMSARALASLVDDMYVGELDRERLWQMAEEFDGGTRRVLSGRIGGE